MKSKLRSYWKLIGILIPFVIGMIGFGLAGVPVLQAAYHCICLYGMGYQNEPANLLIEIARWIAPLATAGSVVLIVGKLRRVCRGILARWTGNSVAVYGPAEEKTALLKELGVRGIGMDRTPVKAHRYILLGEETENLELCRNYPEMLAEKPVYLKCSALSSQTSDRANLHLFCPEEIAARFFWKTYCPYELSAENGHRMEIVLLGFGALGRELILTGLQSNIFDAGQRLEYHVFGEEDGFTKVYHQLGQISDPVTFHEQPWTEHLDILRRAQMILVVQQEGQLALLRDLTLALPAKPIHVLASQPGGVELLARQAPLICFNWKKESIRLEHIVEEKLSLYAKRINLRYAHLYNGVEETAQNREAQWRALDTFTRCSNISAADYHDIQLHMLGGAVVDAETLEWLAELEHIRWCRYHFLNNWTQGVPENGSNKDLALRVHKLLVPYEALSEAEKEKDRENIRVLLALDKSGAPD